MDLTVHINYSAEINELINKFPTLNYLNGINIREESSINWYMNNSYWNFEEKSVFQLQVMFIGKTGYGKSTTLNKIVGKNVFDTSDVESCTKDLYSANYRINKEKNYFLALCDLPGVGESSSADKQYYEWYRDMLNRSHCVVYVLRADQRDFAIDEVLFSQMFPTKQMKQKVIVALNYADKVEPINRSGKISDVQIKNLNRKIEVIENLFQINSDNIMYYSAMDNFNLDKLINKISTILQNSL